ncbi:regulator of G-protein signaling 14 isoform X4 [Notolabrus celidotus]|uniref:regulator of G-protein signaling 14 isoform X4 n=1 Tax=Notolabrus celidotus TaxID=1203425 RepID=UPI00148F5095|nr:regulator of G-protein signaling 14 isoform X4 [Notolabrus celidotus]
MVAFRGLCHRFSRLAVNTAKKQVRKYDKWCTTGTLAYFKSQAVSDGELNMSARGCGGSSTSLPGTPCGEAGPANSVMSWAVSFEKLLEDPRGVQHFTAFLRSEVSEENILFWQDCEKFQKLPSTALDKLKAAARSIYDTYLSDNAPHSVNIDDTAKTEEKDLEQPTPDMFNKAQTQIFKLMKMDSYRRFVRSPLYQSCTLASVDGKLLPQLCNEPVRMGSWEEVTPRSPSIAGKKNGRSSPRSLEQGGGGGGGGRIGVEGGYCCVYLPDGSASLVPTPNGQPIKDMLASLCEKRGFPLKDVIIYLQGKDKQRLLLDQDCSVLRDKQVTLELRVTFALEIAFTGKTFQIQVKSSKLLQDALSTVLQKHQLKLQDVMVTMTGSEEPVNMSSSVFRLANKTLRLDKTKAGKDRISGSAAATQCGAGGAGGMEARSSPQMNRAKSHPRPSKNRDMDGFLDMLTRAQGCRVDDQRGLLTKEQLEIPQFLQVPSKEGQDAAAAEADEPSTTSSTSADSKLEEKLTSGEATSESPDSAVSETKDLKETAV